MYITFIFLSIFITAQCSTTTITKLINIPTYQGQAEYKSYVDKATGIRSDPVEHFLSDRVIYVYNFTFENEITLRDSYMDEKAYYDLELEFMEIFDMDFDYSGSCSRSDKDISTGPQDVSFIKIIANYKNDTGFRQQILPKVCGHWDNFDFDIMGMNEMLDRVKEISVIMNFTNPYLFDLPLRTEPKFKFSFEMIVPGDEDYNVLDSGLFEDSIEFGPFIDGKSLVGDNDIANVRTSDRGRIFAGLPSLPSLPSFPDIDDILDLGEIPLLGEVPSLPILPAEIEPIIDVTEEADLSVEEDDSALEPITNTAIITKSQTIQDYQGVLRWKPIAFDVASEEYIDPASSFVTDRTVYIYNITFNNDEMLKNSELPMAQQNYFDLHLHELKIVDLDENYNGNRWKCEKSPADRYGC